ncbi:MAG: hypothetical protein OXU98_11905 [Gammaproteobacteria bacterium]|nr:hypothetical protein [Gammaproteobacteria bacterium]
MNNLGQIIAKAKQVAVAYYQATGKPLGITGEVGEYEAARILGLDLVEARTRGYDAIDKNGKRYQIKARSYSMDKPVKGRMGSLKFEHEWDFVILILMDECFVPQEIWKTNRETIKCALDKPGSRSRNEKRMLAVSKFKSIGERVWSND